MNKDEVLELALEALEGADMIDCDMREAITAIKEALAQPEPWEKFCDSYCVWTDHHPDCKLAQTEPVAWRAWVSKFPQGTGSDWVYVTKPIMKDRIHNQPLYTTPPQRTWVGLTDKEIKVAIPFKDLSGEYYYDDVLNIILFIQAKLKEKNT